MIEKGTPMSKEQRPITLDDSAVASNPGNLEANLFRWFRHYPTWPLIWFGSSLLFVGLALVVHGAYWIIALPLLGMNFLYWQRIRDHFRYGDTIPAIILSLKPMLIAVSTDLSKGPGKYPAIKIIKKSLPTACGQVPQVGSRLPAIALYNASPDDVPHWSNFDPRPIDCATGSLDTMQTVMSTITEDEWSELMSRLEQVPRPYRCGLYRIRAAG